MAGEEPKKATQAKDAKAKEEKKPQNEKKHKNKKQWKKEKKEIKKEVKKEVKKEDGGPKPRIRQTVAATLAVVDGINEQGPVLSIAAFTNPGLIKAHGDDTAFGPLQANAAQFSLWRVKNMSITATPMVGSSAVSGTIARLSLNMAQTPGATSWGGLGARVHRDLAAGRSLHWKIRDQDLAGPRKGGYWFTDMNMEGGQSGGAVFEMHCFGQTQSTYQDRQWAGPLWIVEIKATWEFSNYNSAPALGTLERVEEKVTPGFSGSAGEPLTMNLPSESSLARFMNEPFNTATRASGDNVGETIYQVVDTGLGVVSNVTPPPFNWLIKGGWWFVKKLLGRTTRAGNPQFYVYASLADAQNNKPAVLTSAVTGTPTLTNLQVTQLNAPNTGPSSTSNFAGGPPIPIHSNTFELAGLILPIVKAQQALNNDVPVHITMGESFINFDGTSPKEHQTWFFQHHRLLDTFYNQAVLEPEPTHDVVCRGAVIGKLLGRAVEPGGTWFWWKGTSETTWKNIFNIGATVSVRFYGTETTVANPDTRLRWWSENTANSTNYYWLATTPKNSNYLISWVTSNWLVERPTENTTGWSYVAGPGPGNTTQDGLGWYHRMSTVPTRKQKLRELLLKLEAGEFSDTSDDSSEEEDEFFQPETKLETVDQRRYEELRQLGLTHEQATKLVELRGTDVVP